MIEIFIAFVFDVANELNEDFLNLILLAIFWSMFKSLNGLLYNEIYFKLKYLSNYYSKYPCPN